MSRRGTTSDARASSPARLLALCVAVITSFALPGCGQVDDQITGNEEGGAEEAPSLSVVATTSILGDVAVNVLGDGHDVSVLMAPGVDPHGYEPSASDARDLREADVVVANGLDLEESLIDVLEAAEEDGVDVFYVTDHVDIIPFALDAGEVAHTHGDDDDREHGDDDGHEHGGDAGDGHGDDDAHGHEGADDPHVWQDPIRMADAVIAFGEHLASIHEELAEGVTANAEAYAEELVEVHERNEERLNEVPDEDRILVTSHDAMGYFADRYAFQVVGAILPGGTTAGDPSGAEFRDLVETVEEYDAPAIFAEVTEPTRLAEALSREAGHEVEVVVLFTDALGEQGSGAETYIGLLETNADRIAEGLTS
jgi:zinc/manganese transport system substrate-binding protein